MSNSILNQIPKEYHNILNNIPSSEMESFIHSFNITDHIHEYLKVLEAVDRTIQVFSIPSGLWLHLYGRIAFIASKYEELLHLYSLPKYQNNLQILPFVARVYTFQNEFEKAQELCNRVIDSINFEDNINFMNIHTFFEVYFTQALIYVYSRQIQKIDEVIEKLESFSKKYIVKKIVSDDYFLDLIFYESIIKVIKGLVGGQPKQMREELVNISHWIDSIHDKWAKGYYYNFYGISNLQSQEMNDAEDCFKKAYEFFGVANDLRGVTTVGANLGTSLIAKGERAEGRKYIEDVIEGMIQLKNYSLAISNLLQVSKSYLDDKNISQAKSLVLKAEELSSKANITEPATFSYFCYFYSRIGDHDQADNHLNKLRQILDKQKSEGSAEDIYTSIWYINAASVNEMSKGNLYQANELTREGIAKADRHGHFDSSLELSTLLTEITLKRVLVEQDERFIHNALELLNDITPLIKRMENIYYESIFNILRAYLFLALGNSLEATTLIEQTLQLSSENTGSDQYAEISLFNQRESFLKQKGNTIENQNLFAELKNSWLSKSNLHIIYVMESLRLLSNLQFQQNQLAPSDESTLPQFLFLLGTGGMTVYSHKFKKEGGFDEVLIGGFLSALTSFSQELFGGGMLTRIDQENHVLLLDKITPSLILVLLVDEETYTLRKRFKKFSQLLKESELIGILDSDFYLSEDNPYWGALDELVNETFSGSE